LKEIKGQGDTHMMKDAMQKQLKLIEKWILNAGQKFLWSRNNFSDMRVITPENNRTVQPEGKQRKRKCRRILHREKHKSSIRLM
jgi:hypothetical protein